MTPKLRIQFLPVLRFFSWYTIASGTWAATPAPQGSPLPLGNPLQHSLLSLCMSQYQTPERQLHLQRQSKVKNTMSLQNQTRKGQNLQSLHFCKHQEPDYTDFSLPAAALHVVLHLTLIWQVPETLKWVFRGLRALTGGREKSLKLAHPHSCTSAKCHRIPPIQLKWPSWRKGCDPQHTFSTE